MDIIDEIYGELDAATAGVLQGDPAEGIGKVQAAIERNGKICSARIDQDGYAEHTSNMGRISWREYPVRAQARDGREINGFVICTACGSVEEPFERYRLVTIIY